MDNKTNDASQDNKTSSLNLQQDKKKVYFDQINESVRPSQREGSINQQPQYIQQQPQYYQNDPRNQQQQPQMVRSQSAQRMHSQPAANYHYQNPNNLQKTQALIPPHQQQAVHQPYQQEHYLQQQGPNPLQQGLYYPQHGYHRQDLNQQELQGYPSQYRRIINKAPNGERIQQDPEQISRSQSFRQIPPQSPHRQMDYMHPLEIQYLPSGQAPLHSQMSPNRPMMQQNPKLIPENYQQANIKKFGMAEPHIDMQIARRHSLERLNHIEGYPTSKRVISHNQQHHPREFLERFPPQYNRFEPEYKPKGNKQLFENQMAQQNPMDRQYLYPPEPFNEYSYSGRFQHYPMDRYQQYPHGEIHYPNDRFHQYPFNGYQQFPPERYQQDRVPIGLIDQKIRQQTASDTYQQYLDEPESDLQRKRQFDNNSMQYYSNINKLKMEPHYGSYQNFYRSDEFMPSSYRYKPRQMDREYNRGQIEYYPYSQRYQEMSDQQFRQNIYRDKYERQKLY